MRDDPLAPGVAPLALLCHKDYVDEKWKFKVNLSNQYKYEVLGGLHTITARKQLLAEVPAPGQWSSRCTYLETNF